MSTRHVIFISAVSSELKTARQAVANCLTSLGYTPEWQDIFATESGPLLQMLRQKVDRAAAVIQIVGQSYGAEPDAPPPGFPRCSYTQYEALYALSRKKPVYYITLGPAFPADPHSREPDELRDLQLAYIKTIEATGHLRHPVSTQAELENKIHRLRDDLAKLRRRTLQWAVVLTFCIYAIAIGVTWLILRQDKQEQKIDAAATRDAALLQAMRALPTAVAEAASGNSSSGETDSTATAYETLEKKLQLPPGTLQSELPAFAARLLKVPGASALDRALALFADKQYGASETAALAAREEALRHQPPDTITALAALKAAGSAAGKQFQYSRALAHYQAAAVLTDQTRDPKEWALVQYMVAYVMDDLGRAREAEPILRSVAGTWERVLGPEHPDTLDTRNNLANVLQAQGKNAESEAEHRAVFAIRVRVLGPEHPDTLASRNNLATALQAQGKNAEAEAEHRAVLAVRERVLGSEHPDTLNNRNSLAVALGAQGKTEEAQAEFRAVLIVRERVLGPDHPDTLFSHYNLALCLEELGDGKPQKGDRKTARRLWEEALVHAEKAQKGGQRTLGDQHPDQIDYTKKVQDLQQKLASLKPE